MIWCIAMVVTIRYGAVPPNRKICVEVMSGNAQQKDDAKNRLQAFGLP